MLSATGIKLPPIALNAATPPTDVVASSAPFGFQLARPAVKLMLASPKVARAPKAVPFPYPVFGRPRSPLIVMPLPPFGLFQAGIPGHCAARGVATQAIHTVITAIRFICILHGT